MYTGYTFGIATNAFNLCTKHTNTTFFFYGFALYFIMDSFYSSTESMEGTTL